MWVIKTDLVIDEAKGIFPLSELVEGESAKIFRNEGDVITEEEVTEAGIEAYVVAKENIPVNVNAVFDPVENTLTFNGCVYETETVSTPVATEPEPVSEEKPAKK